MLRRNESARQRWGGHHQALDHWLEERQQLLVQYFQLAGLPPYEASSAGLPSAAAIQSFCEVLVDYVSTGHFEIYEHLIQQSQVENDNAKAIAVQMFPLIAVTTERVLSFNDKYAEVDEKDSLPAFDSDLSALGEALEVRMELEDQLLQTLEEQAVLA